MGSVNPMPTYSDGPDLSSRYSQADLIVYKVNEFSDGLGYLKNNGSFICSRINNKMLIRITQFCLFKIGSQDYQIQSIRFQINDAIFPD